MSKPMILALALVMIVQSALAGTVTLTGTCSAAPNTIVFNLTNSGNEAATNITITPEFPRLSVFSTSMPVQSLQPGSSASETFGDTGAAYIGGYAGIMDIKYGQDTSTFYAAFPCTAVVGRIAASAISIAGFSHTGNYLSVNVTNAGPQEENVSISMLAPVSFNFTPPGESFYVQPGSYKNASIAFVQPQGSYTVAVVAGYAYNGMYHSSVATLKLGSAALPPSVQSSTLPIIFIGLAIVVILALMVRSILRNKGKK